MSSLLSTCLIVLIAFTVLLGEASEPAKSGCGQKGICECFDVGTASYEVNCSRRNLDACPENIPSNVTKLILSHNLLQVISSNIFNSMTSLKYLDISHNFLKDLSQDSFWGTKDLVKLFLSYNYLGNLPNGLFENTWYLETVNVGHNLLYHISSDLLMNLTKLQTLDMSNNFLKDLPYDIFKQNRWLRKV
ncbi:Insulin-like growth factor-binding protein complex acid labile subunit [Holothuria leucospilota]|uniref:Insulin-like growth factor-binding protein complex acid labile subunit n=1 Tax=Holothuria leucospilota TaxID=206669 RepID=A0A9Q1CP82_HOLLE|nr:Insulin-like growth factor-binding protein complex acid labile subunit [Holothuria leucospilota]